MRTLGIINVVFLAISASAAIWRTPFNGDGIPDLAAADHSANSVTVLLTQHPKP
jgi:hypothetical protein